MRIGLMSRSAITVALVLTGWHTYAAADLNAQYRLNVPPLPVFEALKEFAAQTNLQIVYYSEVAEGMASPGAVGTLTAGDALSRILGGTGLTYQFLNDRTVAIRVAGSGKGARRADGAAPLSLQRIGGGGEETSSVRKDTESFWHRFRLAQAEGSSEGEKRTSENSSENSQRRVELGEIMVTAQKRQERLIDVPQSVTVLSASDLTKTGATQFRDFANAVPGLTFTTQGAGYSQITLRGITTGGLDISPTVGVYVDEVPYGSSTAYANGARLSLDSALFDLERIEVLRGPQGTLYGASTMGGLIKYVSKKPDPERFTGDLRAGTSGTQDGGVSFNVAAGVNAPIVPSKFAVRASAFESRDGGYIDNVTLGEEDVNESDVHGGRFDRLFTPIDDLSIRVTGFMQDISRDGISTVDYTRAGVPLNSSLDQRRAYAEPFEQRFRLGAGTVEYDFGPANLTSISSYQTSKLDYVTDVTAVFVPILAARGRPYAAVGQLDDLETNRFTQEIRLAGATGKPVEWVLGGFYTHESSNRVQIIEGLSAAGQPAARDIFNIAIPSDYKESAAFGDLTYHFTDKFDVTGGLRYSTNDIVFEQTGSGILGVSRPRNTSEEDVVTYLANARYHFSDYSIGYVRYATGYRPGGPNVITASTTQFLTFEADHLDSYEIGYKAESADRAFGIDLAAYYLEWSDIQTAAFRGGLGIRTNAPDGAAIKGTEVAFTARPLDSLALTGTVAYQDARMNAANTDIQAAKDERLPNVPEFTATLTADYTFESVRWRPSIGAAMRHVSERDSSFDARADQYTLPEYTIYDVRGGLVLGRVDVQLYVRNVADERAQLLSLPTTLSAQPSILQPRTYGLTATAHF